MLLGIEYTPGAEADLDEIVDFLVANARRLADRFAERYDQLILRLREFPESAPLVSSEMRQAVVPGTDYLVLYLPRPDRIQVIAVVHGGRAARR